MPPIAAFLAADLNPDLIANIPPAAAPENIAFQESSLCLTATIEQSHIENTAPHIAKPPAVIGVLALTRAIACTKR